MQSGHFDVLCVEFSVLVQHLPNEAEGSKLQKWLLIKSTLHLSGGVVEPLIGYRKRRHLSGLSVIKQSRYLSSSDDRFVSIIKNFATSIYPKCWCVCVCVCIHQCFQFQQFLFGRFRSCGFSIVVLPATEVINGKIDVLVRPVTPLFTPLNKNLSNVSAPH